MGYVQRGVAHLVAVELLELRQGVDQREGGML